MASSILGGMFVLAQSRLRTGVESAGAHGLALELAGQLRAARERAIATQTPVLVGFPSSSGSTATCQSVYIGQGNSRPNVTHVDDFSREFPGQEIFQGYWPLAAGSGPNTNAPIPYVKNRSVTLSAWLPALAAGTAPTVHDPCLIFTPDGNALSNGLVNFQGAYHLVVASGAQSIAGTMGGASSLTYCQLTGAADPFTVTCSSTGNIRVDPGVVGQDGSVAIAIGTPLSAVGAPPSVPAPNGTASITSVLVSPQAPAASNPALSVCAISPGEVVSLTVNATASDGSDLFLTWTSGSGGAFSHSGETKMSWDVANQVWTSTWQWTPPAGLGNGATATLNCAVRNAQGTAAITTSLPTGQSATPTISMGPSGHLLFPTATGALALTDSQGGSYRTLMGNDGAGYGSAALAPDGTVVVYNDAAGNCYTADLGGCKLQCVGSGSTPRLSVTMNRLLSYRPAAGGVNLTVADLSNNVITSHLQTSSGSDSMYAPSWAPDGSRFVYEYAHNSGGYTDVNFYVVNATPTSPDSKSVYRYTNSASGPTDCPLLPFGAVAWSADPTNTTAPLICACTAPDSTHNVYQLQADLTPSGYRLQTPQAITAFPATLSANGPQVAPPFGTYNFLCFQFTSGSAASQVGLVNVSGSPPTQIVQLTTVGAPMGPQLTCSP